MNILLTGATGFIGSAILNKLDDIVEYNVTLLQRNKIGSKHKSIINCISGNSDFGFKFSEIDVVLHCAARVHVMNDESADPLNVYREVNTAGTMNLARQALDAGVKRFIFVSSIKVNGESTQIGHPFRSSDTRRPKDFYGQSKSEAEEQLLQFGAESGLEVVIIRPTLVYGPGVKANFASLLKLVSKGVPLPFGCITENKRSLVSVNNLVDLIVTCIVHSKAVNQVFLVSDDNDVSTATMVNNMSKALGKTNRLLPVPLWCFRWGGKLTGKIDVIDRLLGSLQVDITHTKETLGWSPPQTIEQGFKETADYFLLNKHK
ncbi:MULTISPECIES: UDP-glucose 4-epimerase family protein [unclassified Shewanella]|uniref:UDP-glucose 4-epimerase family protein n=1 Tax=unclassified Shewanella TaxID=196818 RepID=UPI003553DF0D